MNPTSRPSAAVSAQLDPRHLATVLAALRHYQRTSFGDGPEADIATDGGTLAALSQDEIDDLFEVLNDPAPVTLPTDASRDTLLALAAAVRELKDFGGDGGIDAEEAVEAQLQAIEEAP